MQELAALVFLNVLHLKYAAASGNRSMVGGLAAHFRIEYGLVQNDGCRSSRDDFFPQLAVNDNRQNFAFYAVLFIAGKLCGGHVGTKFNTGPA